jgi:hypothetical protein
MITKVTTLKPGEAFAFTGCLNPHTLTPSGIVETVKETPDFMIITTTAGGWYRIHKSHNVHVASGSVTL